MSSCILPQGKEFLARVLAGENIRINGMYVEFGTPGDTPSALPVTRDAEYFDNLLKGKDTGYARIPVTGITRNGTSIVVTGLAGEADYKGGKLTRNSSIVAITLVYMKDGLAVNDDLLITAIPAVPRKIVKGVTSSVSATIKLG